MSPPLTALRGLRVVECGRTLATAYAGRVLAALGADVAVVDVGPGDGHDPGNGGDRAFRAYLDQWKSPGADLAGAAVAATVADIVLVEPDAVGTEWLPPAPEGHGRAVLTVTPFGRSSRRAGHAWSDLTLQAAAGWVGGHGVRSATPFPVGARMPQFTVGTFVASIAVLAVWAARAEGTDVEAEVALVEAANALTPPFALHELFYRRTGTKSVEESRVPLGAERCRDGWVGISTLTAQHWSDVCALVGADEYAERRDDVRQDEVVFRRFRTIVEAWLAERGRAEVVELAQAFRVPAVEVTSGATVADLPQWAERPFLDRLDVEGRSLRVPGLPWRFSDDPGPGGDEGPSFTPRSAARPLEGVRILDLGTNIAVPIAGGLLGAAGADVIKVESVQRPDSLRYNRTSPTDDRWWERSLTWQANNTSKRDVTLDLTGDEGRALFHRLAATADVVVENYSARVLDQLGITYESLQAANPSIILLRAPGFGLEGPMRDHVGFGNTFEQGAGLATVTGLTDGPPVTPGGYMDHAVGMHVAVAVLAAIEERARTGRGRHVEVAQLEVGAAIAAEPLVRHQWDATVMGRHGARSDRAAPQGVYPCRDGWVALTVRRDDEWDHLVELVGDPGLAALAQPTGGWAGRQAAHDRIDLVLEAWTGGRTADQVTEELQRHGIPAAPVLTPDRFTTDSLLCELGTYQLVDHPLSGPVPLACWPVRSDRLDVRHHRLPPPLLGQHNAEVLAKIGVVPAEAERLATTGVIGTIPLGVR